MSGDQLEAFDSATKAGFLALAKSVPVLASLIEGLDAYRRSMAEQQRAALIAELGARQSRLEQAFHDPWYQSNDGQRVCSKILATALNAEFADKVEFLASALLNAPQVGDETRALKFVEILRHVSRPALVVLACQEAVVEHAGVGRSQQVEIESLVSQSGLDARVVEACVQELYSLGVLSPNIGMDRTGRKTSYLPPGTPAFTPFSADFLAFVRCPRDVNHD